MKSSAFTLVEQLLVLLITSLVILLGYQSFQKGRQRYEEEHFIQAFEARYLATQKMAIVSTRDASIIWNRIKNQFEFTYYEDKQLQHQLALSVPATVDVKKKALSLTFKKTSGRNGLMSEYIFDCSILKQRITYTIQMGNGRYVKKITPL